MKISHQSIHMRQHSCLEISSEHTLLLLIAFHIHKYRALTPKSQCRNGNTQYCIKHIVPFCSCSMQGNENEDDKHDAVNL